MEDLTKRIASKWLARNASEAPPVAGELPLAAGDTVTVWTKGGDWWSEVRRGARFTVTKTEGERVWLAQLGLGSPFELKFTGLDTRDRIRLEDVGRFRRRLVVVKNPS